MWTHKSIYLSWNSLSKWSFKSIGSAISLNKLTILRWNWKLDHQENTTVLSQVRSNKVLVDSRHAASADLLQLFPNQRHILGTDLSKMFVKCQPTTWSGFLDQRSSHSRGRSQILMSLSSGRADKAETLVKICGTVTLRWKYLVDTLGANLSRESRGVGDWRGNCVTSRRRLLLPDTLSHRRCQPAAPPLHSHTLESRIFDSLLVLSLQFISYI